jgi:hypothetical protein
MAVASKQSSKGKPETSWKTISATLKRHLWLLAAFFIPLAIRSIPEILSWPYPLGLDTIRYIPTIESAQVLSSASSFIQNQLFYSVATLAYWIVGDGILVIKVFGPLLMGAIAVMMYLFARRNLGWSGFKSFLPSLLVATYFVSLRNSWDLYAQSLALVFLFATLIALKPPTTTRRYLLAFVFMLLTVLGHQLVSVILFFVLGLEALRYLYKRSYRYFGFYFVSLSSAFALFLFRLYSPRVGSIIIPSIAIVSEPSASFVLTMAGLLLYCYGLLLPFIAVGLVRLKSWALRFWVVWCFGAVVALMVFPSLPLYYWNRWVYLLVYPLLFFAVEGLDGIWRLWANHRNKMKRYLPKAVAVVYVGLLLGLSGFYLAANPGSQISFFSGDNPYLSFIPSSMQQNTLPISDNPSLISCFNWVNDNAVNGSVLVEHYALYDLARIYVNTSIVNVNHPSLMSVHLADENVLEDSLVAASRKAFDEGSSVVYTVWWTDGNGWYKIPSLSLCFKEVFRADNLAVYSFEQPPS